MFGLGKKEFAILKKLDTPGKIQDFLNGMKFNFEKGGETFMPPALVLEKKICHCLEGAVLAALALRVHGLPPLVLDLTANEIDYDHVITLFKKDGKWGAISKTNHSVLRYRDPIFNSPRELVMSYFNEYIDKQGRKNLRSYSPPVNLKRFDKRGWMASRGSIEYISKYLEKVKHFKILTKKQERDLRRAEKIEITASEIIEWKK